MIKPIEQLWLLTFKDEEQILFECMNIDKQYKFNEMTITAETLEEAVKELKSEEPQLASVIIYNKVTVFTFDEYTV